MVVTRDIRLVLRRAAALSRVIPVFRSVVICAMTAITFACRRQRRSVIIIVTQINELLAPNLAFEGALSAHRGQSSC
jgi:hypothetical protein